MTFDKKLLIPAPILRPTKEEFENPIEYLSSEYALRMGAEYGIVKVIPPEGWNPPFSINTSSFKFHTRLQKLSDLGLQTRSRVFFKDNINRFIKMKKKKKIELSFTVENHEVFYYDLYVKIDAMGGYNKMTSDKWRAANAHFKVSTSSTALKEEYITRIKDYAKFLSDKQNLTEFPDSDSEDDSDSCLICGSNEQPNNTLLCDNCDNPFHIHCLSPPLSYIPAGDWYCDKCLIGTGEYGFIEPDDKYSIQEFQEMSNEFNEEFFNDNFNGRKPSVDEIEMKFWELIENENDLEVKYGADIHNLKPGEISGFPMFSTPNIDKSQLKDYINHPFNLTRLPFAKGSLLNYINTSISGMTVPWIYIGSLLSTFCWHVEDHYTLSANYCHFGETKKWYGIPSSYADTFERLMKTSAPDLFKKQPDLLHQLVTLLSPSLIAENGIRCVYVDQNPNEFVITYPKVYHSGFNCGFNFNEAVNFTMNTWVNYGELAIKDYRLIKKENVFNHYELMENILKEFNSLHNYGLINQNSSAEYLKLIGDCLRVFKTFTINQNSMCRNKLLSSKDFVVEYKPKNLKKRKFHDEEGGEAFDYTLEEQEDELLCDICKSHLGYQYVSISNSTIPPGESDYDSPDDFSDLNSTGSGSSDGFRNRISQLLTPDTSPLNKEVSATFTRSIPNLESAMKISSIMNHSSTPEPETEMKFKVENDRMQERLGEVFRPTTDSISSNVAMRKRSSSLKDANKIIEHLHPQSQSKMGLINQRSQLKNVFDQDKIKLCLKDCIDLYSNKTIPKGSKIINQVSIDYLINFANLTEKNYESFSKI